MRQRWGYQVVEMMMMMMMMMMHAFRFFIRTIFFNGISIVVHTNYSTKVYLTSNIAYRSNCTNLQLLYHMGLSYIKLNCFYYYYYYYYY
jgi:hypothetical protein